ncbi:recombinase family protein [Ketogulonicigenium vulgare]|uniref:recombinase family protein n=1 Tax=Ketogulonicigenium vulgare TaxID=92945 RepID=UPI0023599571|nr:recombinase family protein [Ketogulonicigenium vulgare]
MTKPLAYSYIRFSSEAQRTGDSIRRQREMSAKYAENNGLQLVADFKLSDLGVSAFKGKNAKEGALRRFLDAVSDGTVPQGSYLLVESLDRLSRQQVTVAFNQLSSIINAGINVVTVSDGRVYSQDSINTNFADLIIALSVMFRANEESETKSRRINEAWKAKRANKSDTKMSARCPAWMVLSEDRKSFHLIEDRAEQIRNIFDMVISGRGLRVITAELNSNKVPAFGVNKGYWSQSSITKIVTGRAAIGEYQPHSTVSGVRVPVGDPIPDYYVPVVSEEVFNLAQVAIKSRRFVAAGRKGKNVANIFSGLCKCGYCGSTMRYINKGEGPKGGKYLICANSQNGKGCDPTYWRYEKFESLLLDYVRDLDLGSILRGAKSGDEVASVRKSVIATEESIKGHKNRINDYLVRIESNPELEDAYTLRMLQIRQDQTKDEGALSDLKAKLDELEKSGVDVSDEEQKRLITAFQKGEGDRFVLADRVRQVIARIDIFRIGPSKPDFSGLQGLPEEVLNAVSDRQDPELKITMRDGDVQILVVDYDKNEVRFSGRGGSKRHMQGRDAILQLEG